MYCTDIGIAGAGIGSADNQGAACRHGFHIGIRTAIAVGKPGRGQQLVAVGFAKMHRSWVHQGLRRSITAAVLGTSDHHQIGNVVTVHVPDPKIATEQRSWSRQSEVGGLLSGIREDVDQSVGSVTWRSHHQVVSGAAVDIADGNGRPELAGGVACWILESTDIFHGMRHRVKLEDKHGGERFAPGIRTRGADGDFILAVAVQISESNGLSWTA